MTITRDEHVIKLPAKVFEFLIMLMAKPLETVTKEQAIDEVWQGNIEVGKRGTGNAIWQLRKTFSELGEDTDALFKTVPKVGYQLLVVPTPVISKKPTSNVVLKKKALQPIFIGLAILLTISAVFLGLVNKPKAPTEKIEKPYRLTNYQGVEESPSISPDGQYLAFQWKQENRNSMLFLKAYNKKGTSLKQLTISEDNEVNPAWSPDSKSLAYLRSNKSGECFVHIRNLITNDDLRIGNGCVIKGFKHNLAWSKNGKWLSYTKKLENKAAIALYDIELQTESILTKPKPGEDDMTMVWSSDSQRILFTRNIGDNASILITDLDGKVNTIKTDVELVLSLAWHAETETIYFNSMDNATFKLKTINLASKEETTLYQAQGLYNIALTPDNTHLLITNHLAQEFVSVRDLASGSVKRQINSSSRDLYGQDIPNSDDVLFLSNRSDSWEVWLKQQHTSKQLTEAKKHGLVSIPIAMPNGNQFIIPMKRPGDSYHKLFTADLSSGEQTLLLDLESDIRNPSLSEDGKRLYFSSNLDGEWAIYRYLFVDKNYEKVIAEGAIFAVEESPNSLYFTKENTRGIYHLDLVTKKETQINSDLGKSDWGNFFVQDNNVVFVRRSDKYDEITRVDKTGVEHILFTLPVLTVRNNRSFSKGENNTVMMTELGINDSDIYRLKL